MIKKAEEQGCKVQCGGKAVEGEEGHFIQPTVLTDLTDGMEISQQEVICCSLPLNTTKTYEFRPNHLNA